MYLRRKYTLIGREIAELQEADTARKRRKALCNIEIQAQNDTELEQYTADVTNRRLDGLRLVLRATGWIAVCQVIRLLLRH